MQRNAFLNAIDVVKPALSTSDIIKIFSHLCFDGENVTAYNDVICIQHQLKCPVEGAIKGNDLIGLLNNSKAKEVELISKGKEVEIVLGRTKVRLPLLSKKDFVFEVPDYKKNPYIKIDGRLIEAIDLCLNSVGSDNTRPAMMGVTFEFSDDKLTLYAANGPTISKFPYGKVNGKPKDRTFVAPTDFCRSLIKMKKSTPEGDLRLYYGKDHLLVNFVTCLLFSKIIGTKRPLDFEGVLSQTITKKDTFIEVPKTLTNALKRALVIQDEPKARTSLKIASDVWYLKTVTSRGEIADKVKVPNGFKDIEVVINPSDLLNGIGLGDQICINKGCVCIKNKDSYMYLVANITE